MPFQSLPIPLTYIDTSQVTDPEHERLKVTFENGMVILLQKSVDDFDHTILTVDKFNSDTAALEPAFRDCFAQQKYHKVGTRFLWWTFWKQATNLSRKEVVEQVCINITLDYERLVFSPFMVGRSLTAMATLPKHGGSGSTLANGSHVAELESVVLDD